MKSCICCNEALLEYTALGQYCPICHSIFSKTIPTEEELTQYYKNYNENYHGGGRSIGALKRQKQYAQYYLEVVNHFTSGGTLIDIGSSNNPFPNIASEEGFDVTVVDIVKPKGLKQEITFLEGTINDVPEIYSEFNVVTAFAVLEHTSDPLLTLKIIIRLCKREGWIVIYIPEIGKFADMFALGTTSWLYPPEHLSLLSKKALVAIMEENGCELMLNRRVELNFVRFSLRYGFGLFEGAFGFSIKMILGNKKWLNLRRKRKSKFQGMAIYVFRKNE